MQSDFFKEEMREDFFVTAKAKKVWAVELELLKEFDRICNENELRYFAAYGTLLGAVRHHGFIPWDDDIDVFMLRDDYDKFVSLSEECVKEPYVFQGIDNGYVLSSHTKLRDSRTAAIEYKDAPVDYNQGIFIDIFPLDDANDGSDAGKLYLEVQKLLWKIAAYPNELLRLTQLGQHFVLEDDLVQDLCNAGPTETMRQLEIFNGEHYGESDRVNFLTHEIYGTVKSFRRECFADTIYVPFENIQIPIPVGYDEILTGTYGDYMVPVKANSEHTIVIMDPDKSYLEYINQ